MSLEVAIKKRFSGFQLDVSFSAEDETLGFLGASGCGKSLTMRCIAGIEKPDEGRIVVNDRVFFDSDAKINLTPQERKTALLFQSYMLFPNLTVAENVAAGIGKDVSKTDRKAIVLSELKRFGLQGFENRYPAQLSGGQQQRVGLARALAVDPKIMLLDEPFGAIDAITRTNLQDELLRLHRDLRKTFLFVTHDINEAFKLGDRVIVMDGGRVRQFDTPRNIALNPADDFTASLIASAREQERFWEELQ